jgi:hypothetical protein
MFPFLNGGKSPGQCWPDDSGARIGKYWNTGVINPRGTSGNARQSEWKL